MDARYFVEKPDGQRYGPADLATLKGWAMEGRLDAGTTLVVESSGERVRADSVIESFGTATAVPPPVGSPVYVPVPVAPRKGASPFLIILIVLGAAGICVVVPLAAILFPVFAQARVAAQRTQGLSGMKQLSTGVLLYGADFDDRFPPKTESARALQPFIGEYVKDPLVFGSRNPKGGEILGDKRLAKRSAVDLAAPDQAILLYDQLPWDGNRTPVAYADGHAKTVPHGSIATTLARDPFAKSKP